MMTAAEQAAFALAVGRRVQAGIHRDIAARILAQSFAGHESMWRSYDVPSPMVSAVGGHS